MTNGGRLLDALSRKLGLDVQYFAASGFWVGFRYTAASAFSIATSVAFARLGSPELYGNYQFVFATASLASLAGLPGLNTVSLRGVAQGKPEILLGATRLNAAMNLLTTAILVTIGSWYVAQGQPGLGYSFGIAGIAAPVFYGLNNWYAYYEGKQDFRAPTLRILLQNLLSTGILVFGLARHWPLVGLIAGYFIVNAGCITYFYRSVARAIPNERSRLPLREGAAYTLQKLAAALPESLQSLIVGLVAGQAALGTYMLAYAFASAANGFVSALSATYLPKIIRQTALDHRRIILQNLMLGGIGALLAAIGIRLGFAALYGGRFQESYPLALASSGTIAFMPLRSYLTTYFTGLGTPWLATRAAVAAYIAALGIFLWCRTASAFAGFVGYAYALQIIGVILLGIEYRRHNASRGKS